ncbi:hypothetical protein GGR50DRAFT_516719 [Xylaria sp. CBS 124048]|nr:hypothetical protein GGR50DRAFT_516719 [Xylaria sp. CBS 124048]
MTDFDCEICTPDANGNYKSYLANWPASRPLILGYNAPAIYVHVNRCPLFDCFEAERRRHMKMSFQETARELFPELYQRSIGARAIIREPKPEPAPPSLILKTPPPRPLTFRDVGLVGLASPIVEDMRAKFALQKAAFAERKARFYFWVDRQYYFYTLRRQAIAIQLRPIFAFFRLLIRIALYLLILYWILDKFKFFDEPADPVWCYYTGDPEGKSHREWARICEY